MRALILAGVLVVGTSVGAQSVEFVRGDGNGDGATNVADPIFSLGSLFQGGPAPCLAALDANDDGAVNIADPIWILGYLFTAGPPPPPPFPDCGSDPTPDALDCQTASASCAPDPIEPDWANEVSTNIVNLPEGSDLELAIAAATPGTTIVLGGSWYSPGPGSNFTIAVQGTEDLPIQVVAAPGVEPYIDTSGNTNFTFSSTAQYVAIRGISFLGGNGILVDGASNIWIDDCAIDATVGNCIGAWDADHLYVTRCVLQDPDLIANIISMGHPTGVTTADSCVIAENEIHSTGGVGIAIRNGSSDNWIVGNVIHDTRDGIRLEGTAGGAPNVVEKNTVHHVQSYGITVVRDAYVHDNLVVGITDLFSSSAFLSYQITDPPENLSVTHNTFVASGVAAKMGDWDSQSGLVFANNACYSELDDAIRFSAGSTGVAISGNVHFGSTSGMTAGSTSGTGLVDFMSVSWDGALLDAMPSMGSPLVGAADPGYATDSDLEGTPRSAPHDTGSYEAP